MSIGTKIAHPNEMSTEAKNYTGGCPVGLPEWVQRVHNDPDAAPLIKRYADALERYRSGELKYVKLLDGGLVDNYGLSGFTVARLASSTPDGPLAPQEAVKLRRFLFLVVDSGRAPSGKWVQTVAGPSGVDLIMATSDTATDAGAIESLTGYSKLLIASASLSWHSKTVSSFVTCSRSPTRRVNLASLIDPPALRALV